VKARSIADIARILTEFVTSNTFRGDELAQVAVDEPLLGSVMDSVDLLNFVLSIEDEFEIRIEDSDVTKENFATISAVAALVARKLADRGPSVDAPAQPASED
jgi:acyl carrier protein